MIFESGDGGEFAIQDGDLAMSETLFTQFYLAWFGGNVEGNTKSNVLINEERVDYWGNTLFWKETPSVQFNSNLERVLSGVVLNSAGRLEILQAAKDDIAYLSDVLTATVDVQLLGVDQVRISVKTIPKDNQQEKVLQLVYDNAKQELIIEKTI